MRLSRLGYWSVGMREQQQLAALFADSTAYATWGRTYEKGGLKKGCLTLTWLASCGQRASHPRGKKDNERQ